MFIKSTIKDKENVNGRESILLILYWLRSQTEITNKFIIREKISRDVNKSVCSILLYILKDKTLNSV